MDAFATLPAATAKFLSLGINDLAESTSTDTRALDQFLASVERKAFRIAQIALRHEDDALDAVQDAMLRLVRSYARRPREEWPPLFYRILENCVRDLQRRRAVRARVMAWVPWSAQPEADAAPDPLEQLPDPAPSPAVVAQTDETLRALE